LDINTKLLKTTAAEYGEQYHNHILEIYKLYLDLSDKLSARRLSVNSFFLTINSVIIGILGYGQVGLSLRPETAPTQEFYWIISALGMIMCVVWFKIIHSYKKIMRARFTVIQHIEQQLPVAAYEAEWQLLQGTKNYQPLTHFEMVVPWMFFLLNLAIALKVAVL